MAESIYGQLLTETQRGIKELALSSSLADANIIVQPAPVDENATLPSLPGILIAPFGAEQIGGGTNASDDIGYPVLVAILDKKTTVTTFANLDDRLFWRQHIIDFFIENQIGGINGIKGNQTIRQTIEPVSAVDIMAWFGKSLFVSPFVIRYFVRKTRRATNT